MSKSLGNVVDPVDIMDSITLPELHEKLLMGNLDPKELKTAERYQKTAFPNGIPECGADALRIALCGYTTGGGGKSPNYFLIQHMFANWFLQTLPSMCRSFTATVDSVTRCIKPRSLS